MFHRSGQLLSRLATGHSLAGDGLLERMRSTTFALLGITAAIGLGFVALIAHQGWPVLPAGPVPGLPSGQEAVGEATPVITANIGSGKAARVSGGPAGRETSLQGAAGHRTASSHLSGSRQVPPPPSPQPTTGEEQPTSPSPAAPTPTEPAPSPAPAPVAAPPPAAATTPLTPSSPVSSTTGQDKGHGYGQYRSHHDSGYDYSDHHGHGYRSAPTPPVTAPAPPAEDTPGYTEAEDAEQPSDSYGDDGYHGHGHGWGHHGW